MADINSDALGEIVAPAESRDIHTLPPVADARLITVIELLFFAYRDFTRDADAILAKFSLGRAQHRVLHFVDRNPGLRVADLLDILKITKQSLAPVLKQLIDEGWIVQQMGVADRRERRLLVTPKGASLARRLDRVQAERVAQALEACEAGHEGSVLSFLFAMINGSERGRVEALLPEPAETGR